MAPSRQALLSSLALFSATYRPVAEATAAVTTAADAAEVGAVGVVGAVKALVGLLVCCVFLVIASALEVQNQATRGIALWALVAAALTVVPVAVLLLSPARVADWLRTLLLVAIVAAQLV